ncbi:MAG: N-acetyltransferase family protein [Actinomycetota bacterium]
MRVRAATPADAEPIADLHVRAWRSAYRGQIADAYLDGLTVEGLLPNLRWSLERAPEHWRMWVAEDEGAIVGFASTGPSQDADSTPKVAELFALYVEPERVGTDLGSALLDHAVDDLRGRGFRAATLWVLETNADARAFYERAGWTTDGATTTEALGEESLPTVRYRTALAS